MHNPYEISKLNLTKEAFVRDIIKNVRKAPAAIWSITKEQGPTLAVQTGLGTGMQVMANKAVGMDTTQQQVANVAQMHDQAAKMYEDTYKMQKEIIKERQRQMLYEQAKMQDLNGGQPVIVQDPVTGAVSAPLNPIVLANKMAAFQFGIDRFCAENGFDKEDAEAMSKLAGFLWGDGDFRDAFEAGQKTYKDTTMGGGWLSPITGTVKGLGSMAWQGLFGKDPHTAAEKIDRSWNEGGRDEMLKMRDARRSGIDQKIETALANNMDPGQVLRMYGGASQKEKERLAAKFPELKTALKERYTRPGISEKEHEGHPRESVVPTPPLANNQAKGKSIGMSAAMGGMSGMAGAPTNSGATASKPADAAVPKPEGPGGSTAGGTAGSTAGSAAGSTTTGMTGGMAGGTAASMTGGMAGSTATGMTGGMAGAQAAPSAPLQAPAATQEPAAATAPMSSPPETQAPAAKSTTTTTEINNKPIGSNITQKPDLSRLSNPGLRSEAERAYKDKQRMRNTPVTGTSTTTESSGPGGTSKETTTIGRTAPGAKHLGTVPGSMGAMH
jgi:hypothetical protein